jgi:hypothetical protein
LIISMALSRWHCFLKYFLQTILWWCNIACNSIKFALGLKPLLKEWFLSSQISFVFPMLPCFCCYCWWCCFPFILGNYYCMSNPCDHGSCVSGNSDYKCNCFEGYFGRNCDIRKISFIPVDKQLNWYLLT